jgi:hypothetical protein
MKRRIFIGSAVAGVAGAGLARANTTDRAFGGMVKDGRPYLVGDSFVSAEELSVYYDGITQSVTGPNQLPTEAEIDRLIYEARCGSKYVYIKMSPLVYDAIERSAIKHQMINSWNGHKIEVQS